MDVVKAVETYVSKLVSEPSSMKVLLLDSHTVSSSKAECRGAVTFDRHQ